MRTEWIQLQFGKFELVVVGLTDPIYWFYCYWYHWVICTIRPASVALSTQFAGLSSSGMVYFSVSQPA